MPKPRKTKPGKSELVRNCSRKAQGAIRRHWENYKKQISADVAARIEAAAAEDEPEPQRKRRGLAESTKELVLYARKLLEAAHPMTVRQLHYAIFSKKEIKYENTKFEYRRLSDHTTNARRTYRKWDLAGRDGPPPEYGIDPQWIVDETRQPETVSVWNNSAEYIEAVGYSYRRDNWQSQMNYCEVWSEKTTVLGSVRPIVRKWGITTRVCHGFGSCGQEQQMGDLFEGIGNNKQITVFWLGDHDPSGRLIEEDIHRRAEEASGVKFKMVRLAIHAEDIKKFNLPPQRIKDTDSRSAGFKRKFGKNAPTVELDALPVEELRRRIDEAIDGLVDHELWAHQLSVQQVELDCIKRIADQVRNLPQIKK